MKPRAAFYAYRLLARFAEILPMAAVAPVSRASAFVAVRLLPETRHVVERNLSYVLGTKPAPSLVQASFASYCRYWLEALRLPVVPRDQLNNLVTAEGLEHLHQALSGGKGAILALPHTGNWDMAGAWLAARDLTVTVVVEDLEPPELSKWFREFRQSLGLNVIVNNPNVGSQLLAALRRNEVLGLICDRDVDGSGGNFKFFGEATKLPKGPATLALRSGAPLLPAAVFEAGRGQVAVILPPMDVERVGRLAVDVDRVTQDLTSRLESLIRRAPEQWHVFQPNWPE